MFLFIIVSSIYVFSIIYYPKVIKEGYKSLTINKEEDKEEDKKEDKEEDKEQDKDIDNEPCKEEEEEDFKLINHNELSYNLGLYVALNYFKNR